MAIENLLTRRFKFRAFNVAIALRCWLSHRASDQHAQ